MDRRRLLALGAWAAPAVLVATATPAAAASGDGPQLLFGYESAYFSFTGDQSAIEFGTKVGVPFEETDRAVTALTVVFSLSGDPGLFAALAAPVITGGSPSWSVSTFSGSDGSATVTLTWAGQLNSHTGPWDTVDLLLRLPAQPGITLNDYAPVQWTAVASSSMAKGTSAGGSVS